MFIGNTIGLDPNSIVGQMVDMALAASQASGKDSGKLAAADGAQAAMTGVMTGIQASTAGSISQVTSLSNLFKKGDTPDGNIDLIAVRSNIGFDLEKSKTTLTTSTVEGSTAEAGNTLSVTATGGTLTDAQSGDIIATASNLSGQNVVLTAPGNVTLQAGYDTTHEVASSKSLSASVGASASIGTKGAGVSVEGQFGFSKTKTNASSSTAVDTTVVGTDNVTIANAAGKTTLNGAEVNGNSINVAAKDLTITTAQDTSRYNSKTTGVNASFSVPVWGAGDIGGSASFSHSKTKDNYASTEATQSGLYAGAGGLTVSVADATTLNGGVIESTANAALNHLTTGSLIANDIANYADASAKTMGYQANVMNPGGATGGGTGHMLTAIGTGMASNAGGLLGAAVHQDASSVTRSAIGANVVVTAGSVSGTLSRDPSSANHPLTNSFDAQKMQNDLQIQQVGSQVVGEVGGVISDALNHAGISGFGTTDVGNAWGRIGLETAGSALVAGLSGGNIGATAAGTAAGDAAAIATREWAGSVAQAITTDGNAQRVIENMLSNAIGASAGAAGGAAAGGSGHTMLNALAGAGYASAIQQFNQANENDEKEANKGPRNMREALDWVLGPSPREVTEEFREQTYDTAAHELAKLDPSNPELQTLTDPNQPRVISDNDVSRMENALLEAREVNRLLTTPEGRKELLAKTPTGAENLTEAAKKVAEQEQLEGIDNSSGVLPRPRNSSDLSGGPLEKGNQTSGNFPKENGPENGTLYRADNQGNITSYAVYDNAGRIMKRVDVIGRAHRGVSTPHVIEYGRNLLPNGEIRVQSPPTKEPPRVALPDEIP